MDSGQPEGISYGEKCAKKKIKELRKENAILRLVLKDSISPNKIIFHNDLCVEIDGDYYVRCSKEIGEQFADREKKK